MNTQFPTGDSALGRSFPLPFPRGFTCTGGARLVPGGFSIPSHDAGEGGAPLDVVAPVTVEGDGGAQFQVCAHSGAVLDGAGVKAGLPGVLCREGNNSMGFYSSGTVFISEMGGFFRIFFFFSSGNLGDFHKDRCHLQGLDFGFGLDSGCSRPSCGAVLHHSDRLPISEG